MANPLKILLVNRHMNIGGVETYLYRLCAGLVQAGHSVGLLTEGGLYEDKVLEAGARLHKVAKLSTDWKLALPELRKHRYQLVHAHNYHSARIGRGLARRLHAPYLMSVHGPRPRLKQLLFRSWSNPVVVMSEGDRENIAWWGGVSRNRIFLSFYGIDVDRFHPGIKVEGLREEFGVEASAPLITFISRFSNRKADVGHALLDALPKLAEAIPGVHALLVGEGPESDSLRDHVARLNAGSPRPLATLVGPRKDVERFMAAATLAVCTANTALEAMACGTPTLAAGRTGYLGHVTAQNFEYARSLCFADHGTSPYPMSPEAFIRDVPPLLAAIGALRQESLEAAHLIAEKNSVPRMAEQMETLYRSQLSEATV